MQTTHAQGYLRESAFVVTADGTAAAELSLIGRIQWSYLEARAPQVIGPRPDFRGDPACPYTLVEFGDYQCGPCRAADRQLTEYLEKYTGKVRFTFRNFPLTAIHPCAYAAAEAAEVARDQGKFWLVHDALYREDTLDFGTIRKVIQAIKLDGASTDITIRQSAAARIATDMSEVKRIGANGTPTFYLCDPEGRVMRLNTLSDLDQLVR